MGKSLKNRISVNYKDKVSDTQVITLAVNQKALKGQKIGMPLNINELG